MELYLAMSLAIPDPNIAAEAQTVPAAIVDFIEAQGVNIGPSSKDR